jgi:hypothetical protein
MSETVEIGLGPDGRHLVAGHRVWLYRFVPMQSDPMHQIIRWGMDWPTYLEPWITSTWQPVLVRGALEAKRPVRSNDLGTVKRQDAVFPGEQAVYRGWWLYTHRVHPKKRASIPGLFERVPIDISPLEPAEDPGDPSIPTGGP